MTKKDYIAVAAAIKHAADTSGGPLSVDHVVANLCRLFLYDNERFNPDRFKAACKGEPWKVKRGPMPWHA